MGGDKMTDELPLLNYPDDSFKCYQIAMAWLLGEITEDEALEQLVGTRDGPEALLYWAEKVLIKN
jgi:hypothetical protein